MPEPMLCRCGHPEEEHYTYIRNGEQAWCCRSCDPMSGIPAGNYAMDADSYVAAMYRAADHAFDPVERPKSEADE